MKCQGRAGFVSSHCYVTALSMLLMYLRRMNTNNFLVWIFYNLQRAFICTISCGCAKGHQKAGILSLISYQFAR